MKLSICIPTYNRACLLRECLESLEDEVRDRCEVVIVDGASADDTPAVAEDFRRRIPHFKYLRREQNVGVDEDILKMVEISSGEYCWLFSDDDWMEPGSMDAVLEALAAHEGLAGISLHSTAYESSMRFPLATVPAAGRGCLTGDHLFRSTGEAFSVLGIHFGYISCQVVRRDLWLDVTRSADLQPYIGSCWLMVFMIGRILERQPVWLYLDRSCVRNRTANDSFVQRMGIWKRQLVCHVEFFRVLGGLFPRSSSVYRAVQSILIHDRMPRTLAKLKADGIEVALQVRLFGLYTARYWTYMAYWLKVVPLFFFPGFIFRAVRKAYFQRRARLSVTPQKS